MLIELKYICYVHINNEKNNSGDINPMINSVIKWIEYIIYTYYS